MTDTIKIIEHEMIKYFQSGEKSKASLLGLESEHFIINKDTYKSYDFYGPYGTEQVLKKMLSLDWKKINEDPSYVLALEKNKHTISIEPAGQIEISLAPMSNVIDIQQEYESVLEDIKSCLEPCQSLVATGYHPKSKISELKLLPKERYLKMFEYFENQGELGPYMMKGTCATQVSIDYENEKDFIKKYRVANFLAPFFSRLMDVTFTFEGEPYQGHNLRAQIWKHTGKDRHKLIPGTMDTDFNYTDYADYVLSVSPIVVRSDKGYDYEFEKTLGQYIKLNSEKHIDAEYALGMIFPDVRLKKYIEIRIADAVAAPYNLAYVALIKGLFYDRSNLNYLYEISKEYSDEDMIRIIEGLKKHRDVQYKDINSKAFILELMTMCKSSLSDEECHLVDELYHVIESAGSLKCLNLATI